MIAATPSRNETASAGTARHVGGTISGTIRNRSQRYWSTAEIEIARKARERGAHWACIAHVLGRSRSSVKNAVGRAGQ